MSVVRSALSDAAFSIPTHVQPYAAENCQIEPNVIKQNGITISITLKRLLLQLVWLALGILLTICLWGLLSGFFSELLVEGAIFAPPNALVVPDQPS